MRSQRGLGLLTLILGGAGLGMVLLLGFKMIPAFSEYFGVKAAVASLAKEKSGAPLSEIREQFDKRATIEDIKTVSSSDLDIIQDKSGTSISIAYDREVPLFANVSLLFHFQTEARGGGAKE